MLEDWNLMAIGEGDTERELLKELEEDGKFESSGFQDIVIGQVEDIVEFLEDAENKKLADTFTTW